jgi:hypothetical protein
MCKLAKAAITNGNKKCRVKNFPNVGLSTENPPHSHNTNFTPTIGTAENKFVITVAPQRLICPQGSTYPKNAVAMTRINITTPVSQAFIQFFVKDAVIKLLNR